MSFIRGREFGSLSSSWTPQVYPFEVQVVSQASDLVVTLGAAKNFLRVYDNVDDLTITSIIQGVTIQVEKYINKSILLKTYKASWRRIGRYVRLPYAPFVSITSATAYDVEGNTQALVADTNYYIVGNKEIHVELNGINYPFLDIVYTSGYADVNQVPQNIAYAILQEVSLQYKNRQNPNSPKIVVNGLTLEARNLLQSEIDYVL